MPIEITQVTTANIVIPNFEALNNEAGIYRFLEQVDGFITTSSGDDGTLTLDVTADRINVARTPEGRTTIKRDYPVEIADLKRLAEVADLVISNTNTDLDTHTFGFNVEAVCAQRSEMPTSRYLAHSFFDLDALSEQGFSDFESDTWHLAFTRHQKTWRMGVRQIDNALDTPNLFVTLNSHHENQPLPDKQSILNGLTETWNNIPQYFEQLEHKS